jgi:hypothetical protein
VIVHALDLHSVIVFEVHMETVDPLPEVSAEADKRVFALRRGSQPAAAPPLPEVVQRKAVYSFGRRMLSRRLQSLVVTMQAPDKNAPPSGGEGIVTVQPVVPGALVTPALADVSTSPGSTVRFSVLPLVKGKLRDARVELRQRGRAVDSTPLPMKVTRRCFAKCFLLFAILITVLLAYDRHVTRWYPSFTYEMPTQFAPKPAAPGRGMPSLPPPPKPGEDPYITVTLKGEAAVSKWFELKTVEADRAMKGSAEVSHYVIYALGWIHSYKYGGDEESSGDSLFILALRGWEFIRSVQMAEVYVGALLIGLALVVYFLSGASRGRKTSRLFDAAIA